MSLYDDSLALAEYLTAKTGNDFSPGTANYEILVKGLAAILAQQTTRIDAIPSLVNPAAAAADPAVDLETAVQIASLYGVEPRQATFAEGVLALQLGSDAAFSVPAGTIFVIAGISCATTETLIAAPSTSTSNLRSGGGTVYKKNTVVGGIASSSIRVSTLAPTSITVPAGAAVPDISVFNPNVVGAYLLSTLDGGALPDSKESLLRRVQDTNPSAVLAGEAQIVSYMLEQFSCLSAAACGMGHPLQTRDTHNPLGVAAGGRVDVYVQSVAAPHLSVVSLPVQGDVDFPDVRKISLDRASGFGHAYFVRAAKAVSKLLPYTLSRGVDLGGDDNTHALASGAEAAFSLCGLLRLDFAPDIVEVGTLVELVIVHDPNIPSMQKKLDSPEHRCAAADLLVRGGVPIRTLIGIALSPKGTAVDITLLQSSIAARVNNGGIGKGRLYVSEIVAAVLELYPAVLVQNPVSLVGSLPDPTTGLLLASQSSEYLEAPQEARISAGNCFFTCYAEDVSITLT